MHTEFDILDTFTSSHEGYGRHKGGGFRAVRYADTLEKNRCTAAELCPFERCDQPYFRKCVVVVLDLKGFGFNCYLTSESQRPEGPRGPKDQTTYGLRISVDAKMVSSQINNVAPGARPMSVTVLMLSRDTLHKRLNFILIVNKLVIHDFKSSTTD